MPIVLDFNFSQCNGLEDQLLWGRNRQGNKAWREEKRIWETAAGKGLGTASVKVWLDKDNPEPVGCECRRTEKSWGVSQSRSQAEKANWSEMIREIQETGKQSKYDDRGQEVTAHSRKQSLQNQVLRWCFYRIAWLLLSGWDMGTQRRGPTWKGTSDGGPGHNGMGNFQTNSSLVMERKMEEG